MSNSDENLKERAAKEIVAPTLTPNVQPDIIADAPHLDTQLPAARPEKIGPRNTPVPPISNTPKKPSASLVRKILNLSLFAIALSVFAVAALVINFYVYRQWAMNAPDMKARTAALGLVHQNKIADAERLLEPFVFTTKNQSHECAKLLSAIYAIDHKFDKMEATLLALSSSDEKKMADHMHYLGTSMSASRPEVAHQVIERTAGIYKRLYGEDQHYAKEMSCLANCDLQAKKFAEAVAGYKIAIPLLEKTWGQNAKLTMQARVNLGKAENRVGR